MRIVRQTDMTNLIIVFRNFANASKNSALCPHSVFYVSQKKTGNLSAQNINWLVFVTETECVY